MPQHIAIAGGGITGLACAYLLSEAGHEVTIVARNFYGDKSTEWASPWSVIPNSILSPWRTDIIVAGRAGALLAPHPDTGSTGLQLASLDFYRHLFKTSPESGVKVSKV
jgi:D-amino-acid oxidase